MDLCQDAQLYKPCHFLGEGEGRAEPECLGVGPHCHHLPSLREGHCPDNLEDGSITSVRPFVVIN